MSRAASLKLMLRFPQFGQISATGVAFALLCFCLLLAVSSPAQVVISDSAPQAANAEGKFTVSGTVINSATGEGVAHAMVEISSGTGQAMLTGLDGGFEFADVPQGEVTVSAHKPGFFNEQDFGNPLGVRPVIARVGPDAPAVVVKLIPQAVITGHVEAAGTPLEGIPIRLLSSRIQEGRRHWEPGANTVSDEDGDFRIAGLTPGSYYVEAGPGLEFGGGISIETEAEPTSSAANKANPKKESHPKEAPAEKEEGYPALFYAAAPDISAATPIDLAAGDQATANFSLKGAAVYRLSGVIIGLPVGVSSALSVESASGEMLSVPNIVDQRTGKFTVKVPADSYTLVASAQGADELRAKTTLEVTSDVAGIRLVLAPESSIPLEVTREPSGTASARTGAVRLGNNSFQVHLISRNASLGAADYWSNPGPEGRGPIALRGVQPGTYSVEFANPYPWHVQSAECGGVDLLRDDLTVVAGAQTPPIEIVLRDDSATLDGTVTADGEPVTAAVVAVSQRAPRQPAIAVGQAEGEFQFPSLPPGDYSVFAISRLDQLAYTDPDAIQPYLAKATHVTLQPNEKANIKLEVLVVGR